MELNTLTRPTTQKRARRIGRGSKRGKTSGRGTKGQKARAGNKRRPEMREILKKIPKRRGFGKNRGRTHVPRPDTFALPLVRLAHTFESGAIIDRATLAKAGLVDGRPVKILGNAIDKKFIIKGVPTSVAARVAIEKAGGSVL